MLDESGVWTASQAAKLSYPEAGHGACFSVEDGSFWFSHRNECILALIKAHPPRTGGPIFDVGGGNGFVASRLAENGFEVVLVEPGPEGAQNAKRRGIEHVVCATTESAGFSPNALPAIGLFDVIEHIEDDVEFLRSMRGLLRHMGQVYVTVPAHTALWSNEDVRAGHFRRYSLGAVSKLLESTGFRIDFASYIFRPLPIPIFAARTVPSIVGRSAGRDRHRTAREHGLKRGPVAKLLDAMLGSEIENIKHRRPMRFGASCLVAATASMGS
ncbi:MAG: class I SAM-dependent methyltransferase [Deltaproteobacteria bacterium]|nr:class I SAM-dependent methyltransferase [Deltaproteobacteria bacterium]